MWREIYGKTFFFYHLALNVLRWKESLANEIPLFAVYKKLFLALHEFFFFISKKQKAFGTISIQISHTRWRAIAALSNQRLDGRIYSFPCFFGSLYYARLCGLCCVHFRHVSCGRWIRCRVFGRFPNCSVFSRAIKWGWFVLSGWCIF